MSDLIRAKLDSRYVLRCDSLGLLPHDFRGAADEIDVTCIVIDKRPKTVILAWNRADTRFDIGVAPDTIFNPNLRGTIYVWGWERFERAQSVDERWVVGDTTGEAIRPAAVDKSERPCRGCGRNNFVADASKACWCCGGVNWLP